MNTKTIAIALVAIIVVAGAIIAIPKLTGDEEKSETFEGEDARLMIYGNANCDDYLDEKDIEYLKKIINKETNRTAYCDANLDGRIDQKDIDMVTKMIAREPMEIYYQDALHDEPKKISYPVKTYVSIENETNTAIKILGKISNIKAHSGIGDKVLFSDMPKDALKIKGEDVPLETLSELNVDAVITHPVISNVKNQAEIESSGIPVIRLAVNSSDPCGAYLTLGYLIEAEQTSHDFVAMCDKVIKEIADKVNANVAPDDKKKAMVLGYAVLYGRIVEYGNVIETAGGINAVNWFDHRWTSDAYEWLYDYKFDWVVNHSHPGGYEAAFEDKSKDAMYTWDKMYDKYKATEAVHNGGFCMLEMNLPVVIRAAYLAEEFYPEIFGENFAEDIHQEYLDQFLPNLKAMNFDVHTQGIFYVDFDNVDQYRK